MNKKQQLPFFLSIKYSIIVAWLAFFFSCYNWIFLFKEGSGLWTVLGSGLLITLYCLIAGVDELLKMLTLPLYDRLIKSIVIIFSSICYFFSSIIGLMLFLDDLPITDKSILLMPVLALCFLFAGSAYGLYQSK